MSKRDEYDDWRGDVIYDTWREGGNVDALNEDRMYDAYRDGVRPDDFVHTLQREAADRREQRQMEQEMRDEADYERYCEYLEQQQSE